MLQNAPSGCLQNQVAEQTSGPLGSVPFGYWGFTGVITGTGMFGMRPCVTALFRASSHGCGTGVLAVNDVQEGGNNAVHSVVRRSQVTTRLSRKICNVW